MNLRRIASGTVFYNDCRSLKRTLDSLYDKMDCMICVDGRFKHFDEGKADVSTDGSRELVSQYDNAMLLTCANSYEVEKRQMYVDACNHDYEFLFIVDSDEYVIEYNQKEFHSDLEEIYNIPYYNRYNVFAVYTEVNSAKYKAIAHEFVSGCRGPPPNNDNLAEGKQWTHYPRIWLRPWQMSYNAKHYYFHNKDPTNSLNAQETNAAVKIVKGIRLGHDHVLRDEKHLWNRKQYQKWLVDFEQNKLDKFMRRGITPNIEDYDRIDHDRRKSTG